MAGTKTSIFRTKNVYGIKVLRVHQSCWITGTELPIATQSNGAHRSGGRAGHWEVVHSRILAHCVSEVQ